MIFTETARCTCYIEGFAETAADEPASRHNLQRIDGTVTRVNYNPGRGCCEDQR